MPDDTVTDLGQTVVELRRELDARTAERDEALAREAAASEVLQVINSSPGDLVPVFDAMLEKAMRLCDAVFGELRTYDGERFHLAAIRGVPAAYADYYKNHDSGSYGPGTGPARILAGEAVVHVPDLLATEPYRRGDPDRRALVHLGGARAILLVPLVKDRAVIGFIMIYRQEPRPFSDKQIFLLQNFAAQAVIAMENARLLTETREALAQQTATGEILGVISRSPTDIRPVFEAIVENASRLCEAEFSAVARLEGGLLHLVALNNMSPEEAAAFHSLFPRRPGRRFAMGRALVDARPVHIDDVLTDLDYDPRTLEVLQSVARYRSFLAVPIFREGRPVGVVGCGRREVKPFTATQIDLVKTFADQAAIAIENIRLFEELETRNRDLGEALEQQTATAEVLQVINSSPGNLAPVFDAMLDKALGLCGAAFGVLWTYDGERVHAAALRGVPPEFAEFLTRGPHPVGPDNAHGRLLRGEPVVHIADVAEDKAYRSGDPIRRTLVQLGGGRTLLAVPLRKDGAFIGDFVIYRQEVRPFSDKQISLLQNFAAQAVIAMENARLLTETREALEQQTATAEVLQVINSSPGELQPVFEAILAKAHSLCSVSYGSLQLWDGEKFRAVAVHGLSGALEDRLRQGYSPGPTNPVWRLIDGERFAHTPDLAEIDDPVARSVVELGGAWTLLWVALRRDAKLLGLIAAARPEVRPFSDKQIALLQNFADQAVIAMENARLITETREALEYQTATSDVLKVISQSGAELESMLETLVETAARICQAEKAVLGHLRDGLYYMGASVGFTQQYKDYRAGNPIPLDRGTAIGRMALERRVIHIQDASNDPEYADVEAQRLGRFRTVLSVPLLRENAVIGGLFLARSRVEPFTEKHIELVTTFADQAVIAIENARLLNELRARTEELARREDELRVTFDNMGDGVAMFDGERRLAAWNRNFQEMLDLPDAFLAERPHYAEYFRYLAARGEYSADVEAELSRAVEDTDREMRFERTRPDGRVVEVRRNAVPGGGFVLIYSDITERKRAEQEIRAARDTAEKALQELQAAQASLLHAQKMAALGQLTAGIAHEIKNPLNFVNNFAGLSVELLDELKETAAPAVASLGEDTRAEIDEIVGMLTGNLEKIAEHGRRADGIVKSMLAHSRGGSGDRQAVDINTLVEDALNLAYHGARAQDQNFNITLERDFDRDIAPIELVPQDVTRVFLNLFGNGFYAADRRRHEVDDAFRPTLKVTTRDLGGEVEIRVRDNGTGIPPELRDKLFQPFFTTKPTGEGTGLGLSISYDIITQQHGGTIEVDSTFGEFTEFTIRLPWRRQLNPHSTPGTPAPAGGHLGAPRLAGEGIGGGLPRSRRTQP